MRENSPLFELCIENAIGESLSANSNPFQNAIAPKLVQNKERIHHPYQIQAHFWYNLMQQETKFLFYKKQIQI